MSMVHASRGGLKAASEYLKSEPAIVAGLAKATLPNTRVPWDELVADYSKIRDGIEAGEFEPVEPRETARIIQRSLVAFEHPVLIATCLQDEVDVEAEARATVHFLLRAITPRS